MICNTSNWTAMETRSAENTAARETQSFGRCDSAKIAMTPVSIYAGGITTTYEGPRDIRISADGLMMYETWQIQTSSQGQSAVLSGFVDLEQRQENNTHLHDRTKVHTDGSAAVIEVFEEICFGIGATIAKLKLTSADGDRIERCYSLDEIQAKSFPIELEKHGIRFQQKDSRTLIQRFLFETAVGMKPTSTVTAEGAYLDAEGGWHIPDEDSICKKAVYAADLQTAFGAIPGSQDMSSGYRAIIEATLFLETQSNHLCEKDISAIYILETPVPAADSRSFADETGGTYFTKLSGKTVKELRPGLNVVNLGGSSPHMLQTHLAELLEIGSDKTVVAFAKKQNEIAEILGFEGFVSLEYKESKGGEADVDSVIATTVREMGVNRELSDAFLFPNEEDRFKDFPEDSRRFAARAVALAEALFRKALVDAEKETKKFEKYLLDCACSADCDISAGVVSFLKKSTDIISLAEMSYDDRYTTKIGISRDRIAFTAKAFLGLAESLGYRNVNILAKKLKERGYLITGSRYEIPVTVQGGQVNMYVLSQTALFGLGNLRFDRNEFLDSKPEIMIPIGQNGKNIIYYTIPDLEGSVNGHVYVSGDSGSGKSYLLYMLAGYASISKVSVVFLCLGLPRNRVDDAEILEISSQNKIIDWGKCFKPGRVTYIKIDDDIVLKDTVIREFNKQKERFLSNPCILIIDECQEFDMGQLGAINEILRQGRKKGILLFLASQYLTAQNGTNICHCLNQCKTNIVFNPVNEAKTRRRLGISDTDSEMKSFLREVPTYSCMVRGDVIASKCGYVRYPIVMRAMDKLNKILRSY